LTKAKRLSTAIVLQRFGPLLGLMILCGVLGILSDHFLTFDNLVNVFRQSAVNALVALGQLAVIVTAGIDLSVGSILGLSCVLAAQMLKAGVPPAAALVAALGIGAAMGSIKESCSPSSACRILSSRPSG